MEKRRSELLKSFELNLEEGVSAEGVHSDNLPLSNPPLLILNSLHRVCSCGFDGLPSDGDPGDEQGDQAGQHEQQKADLGAVSKVFEPAAHDDPGGGPGDDDVCDEHPFAVG